MRVRLSLVAFCVGLVSCTTNGPVATNAPPPVALPASASSPGVSLASASSTICVPASRTAQTVTLPQTGDVTATLALAQYDAGSSGCQNITIATGAAAAAAAAATSAMARRTRANGPNPIITTTLGQGLPSNLGLVTLLNGAQFAVSPNVVLPNGNYNATVTWTILGAPLTISLVFTASNGTLTISKGTGLPINMGAGAQIQIYAPGVIPPNFGIVASPTPSPTPSTTPTPVPSPTSTPSGGVYGAPAPTGVIGTQSYADLDPCPPSGFLYSGYLCNRTTDLINNGSTATLIGFPAPGDNGQASYTVTGFNPVSYLVIGCDPPITYSGGGLSGTFTIPAFNLAGGVPNPAYATFSGHCEIDLSTLPIGLSGSYYSLKIVLFSGGTGTIPTAGPYIVVPPTPTPTPTPTKTGTAFERRPVR